MIRHFDHVTVVVRDLDGAKRYFGLLGFVEEKSVVISGPVLSRYMGIDDIEADHVTLVLPGASPRLEVQILRYHRPGPVADPEIRNLSKLGYNHVCFAVDDLDATVARLVAAGVEPRGPVMEFHDRNLVFLYGPEGITVELAEWIPATRA